MLYESFIRRTTVEELNHQRLDDIRALKANGTYLESKEGLDIRKREIDEINSHYNGLIDAIMDPSKHERKMEEIRNNPLLSAGVRGFDRLKWNLEEGIDIYGKSNG